MAKHSPGLLAVLSTTLLTGCWMTGWPYESVAFLYVGPVGDHGWTKAHDDGRLYLQEHLEGATTDYYPSVLVADALGVAEDFIAQGNTVVITTSYDFISSTQTAAANYPSVDFLNCSSFVSSPNLGSYFGRMYQAWYLAGIVAGSTTVTGNIGVVGPVVIPETVRHLDALTLGVHSVNPSAQVRVEWINAWFDSELEPEVTQQLLDWDADVIVSKTDTTIPLATVQEASTLERPLHSIGYDNEDSCALVGDTCLTSPYWNWGPLYTRLVQQMQEGTWDPYELVWDQMQATPEKSTVYLALSEENSNLSPDLQLDVETAISELAKEANIHFPFQGPILDNQGAQRVAEGDEMADDELLRMCWYVEGIVDEDGNPATVPTGCGGDY